MSEVIDRLVVAMNAHDLDAVAGFIHEDYRSEQPAHPDRAFIGSEQVRENWTGVFAGVPDFHAGLVLLSATADGVEIGEWHWSGTHADGASFEMRGMTLLAIENDRIAWGRLYMEPVEHDGRDIDEMVRESYRPPSKQ